MKTTASAVRTRKERPPRGQRAQVAVQPDGGKEVQQQDIAGALIEGNGDVGAVVECAHDQSPEHAANQRFGNAVATQPAHAGDQALAAEQQQDRQRHSKEGIDLHQKCLPMVTVP